MTIFERICDLLGCIRQDSRVADKSAMVTATGVLLQGQPGTVFVIKHIAIAGTGGGSTILTAQIGRVVSNFAGIVSGYDNFPCEVRIDEGQSVTATISATGYATVLYYEVMP